MSGSRLAESVNPWNLLTSVSSCGSYVRASLIMLEDPGETCCGGWNIFHDPSKVLPKFTPNFTIFSRKTKAKTIGIPGTEFEPHPKDLDVKNQFFCLHIFVFHPNHNFSTILESENQLKQENIFWNSGKRKTKKLSALFWFFAQNFFFRSRITRKLDEIERFWAKN